MADVLAAPTQKLDGPAPVAGRGLVDLSQLDANKTTPTNAEKQAAAAPDAGSPLTKLTLIDDSQPAKAPVKIADNAAPAPLPADVTPAPATAKAIDNQPAAAAAPNDCDKTTACSFTPTTDREKSKPWWDARAQLVGTAPEKDANCLYTVKFGDDLSTIAQRQLQAEGKAVNAASLKAEQDKLICLNDAQYKSLDCNKHYLQVGWRLKLADDCTAAPAPVKVEVPPPPPPPAPVERQAAPVEAPLPPPPPVDGRPPCNDAPLPPPPPRMEQRPPCDDVYIGRSPSDRGYQREEHMYVRPGRHFIEYNGVRTPYELQAGQSMIYDYNGHQGMVTGCNQDGSYPQNSQIIYRLDQRGERYDVTSEQQQTYYQRFAPEFAPGYHGPRIVSGHNGGQVQDQYSIQERQVNDQRRHHDDEARRLEAERLAAERHNLLVQPVAPTVRPLPVNRADGPPAQTPVQRIETLPTTAERTEARRIEAEKIHAQQTTERQDKLARDKAQEEANIKRAQDEQTLRNQEHRQPQPAPRVEAAPPPRPLVQAVAPARPAAPPARPEVPAPKPVARATAASAGAGGIAAP